MKIEFLPRKSPVLSSSSLACLSGVASINLTLSCAHRCVYCYACGYSVQPTQGAVGVYSNLFEKLKDEWPRKRKKTQTVYFSPSSDLFQPIPEVLQNGYDIIEFLLEQRRNVAFVTKGVIPDSHFELFRKYPKQIQAQIGLISCDDAVLSQFEPNAAPSQIRVAQMQKLTQIGITTTVRADPIIPGVTDDEETFTRLCESVSRAGVKTIAASVLFLRPAIKDSLLRNISDTKIQDRILARFADSTRLPIQAERSYVSALRREDRETIFKKLYAIAQHYGLDVHVCGCKNPDISIKQLPQNCRLCGDWSVSETTRNLFDYETDGIKFNQNE